MSLYFKKSVETPVTFSSLYSKQGIRSFIQSNWISQGETSIKLFSYIGRRACHRQEKKCWNSTGIWKLDEKEVKCFNLFLWLEVSSAYGLNPTLIVEF